MWMSQISHSDVNLRHTCEQGDELSSYSWLIHDGINFGMQQIQDTNFTLTTTFVKRMGGEHGGDWTWRITGKQRVCKDGGSLYFYTASQAPIISLMFYVATDTQGSLQAHIEDKTRLSHVTGTSEEFGDFKITFNKPTSGEAATDKYASEKFEVTFGLQAKEFTSDQVRFAKAALSNMLGGMGYFFGQSVVQSNYHEHPILYPEAALFTAVPSRSFFPRGFLWDEGFHQLLITKWDPQVTRESVAHWLDLMNVEGWIPREQILGDEALSKVPSEFVVQHTENANPPTFFLVLEKILEQLNTHMDAPQLQNTLPFLRRLYPRLQTWFEWYNTTQAGPLPNSYRWRGRDKDTNRFLNPKTLTSGLDDYPRASHPSEDERHVDLYCWMVLASRILTSIARLLGEPHQEYEHTYQTLSNNSLLSELHWSEQLHAFCDYGNHTQDVFLQQEKVFVPPEQINHELPAKRLVRSVHKAPKLQYVNALGYVSLFPFLLQVLTPDSQKLEYILKDIRDPARLWTPYGLRSLSRSDPMYMRRNTENDAPYWRGAIWININYLALRALHHYSRIEGPYHEKAADLYQELRTNVINNIYKQYHETGYIWEQYRDST
ncbi:hypothetical protein QTP86_022939, partial [Hemibagrus guttatus]